MKKTARLLTALLSSFAFAAPRTADQIKASGTLKLATEGAFPPFNFYEGKVLKGFEIDLGEAIAKAAGLKVEWTVQPFDTLLIGLNQGRYDAVIASHAITPERQKAVDFLSPHYCSTVNLVAKKGGPVTEAAMKGKSVAVQVGTSQISRLKAIAGIGEIKTFPSDQANMQALMSGRTDAWASNGPVLAYMIKQTKLQNQLVMGPALSVERNGIAVAKGNKALQVQLDAALKKVLNDGTYLKLSKQWFGQDIRCK